MNIEPYMLSGVLYVDSGILNNTISIDGVDTICIPAKYYVSSTSATNNTTDYCKQYVHDYIYSILNAFKFEFMREIVDKLTQFHNEHYEDANSMSEDEFRDSITRLLLG